MIKEFAFSLSNRHHFHPKEDASKWMGTAKDIFQSLYDYDDYIKEFYKSKSSLSGFDGLIYIPDEFILDVDGKTIKIAKNRTIGLIVRLDELDIPYKLYFSGTGFHIGIPSTAFRWEPAKDLHLKVKDCLNKHGIFEYADSSVTDKTRIVRLVNTRNSKSKLFKVEIKEQYLYADNFEELICEYARSPREVSTIDMECDPVFDVLSRVNKSSANTPIQITSGDHKPDPVNYTCIQRMMDGVSLGSRHQSALRIASHLRWRYPRDFVEILMEHWRKKVDKEKYRFTERELKSIIESCYSGHGGQGYKYGCNDPLKDKNCSKTCVLYKTKASTEDISMDSSDMEAMLSEFYVNDIRSHNIGALYGQNFPIFPGEVVVIQAPPASMKTMLLQNWMTQLKVPTLFIEMEMSPRQIWSRFVQIEMGWDEEQLKDHYKSGKNGMGEKFDWLTVDYNSPHPFELQKRVQMLPVKPEIVVVDHMGLFKSKHKDINMKMEEASQCLMELAVKENVVVFAVCEITKNAFHEGMDIASGRGSFRIAYNANKVLSLKPYKGENGMTQHLGISTTKNREKEQLDIKLKLNNLRMEAS